MFDKQIGRGKRREKKLTGEQALQKLKHYCGYQERCHNEVKEKLYELGIERAEQDKIICTLVEENYLDEERFAIRFASGKFRMKQWGRTKIKYELKQKQVSEYCIKKAIKEIDEKAYLQTLHRLAAEMLKTLKGEKNIFIKKRKLQDHLLRKGYEAYLVKEETNNI